MSTDRQPVRFGIFEVNLVTCELHRNGAKVKLQEQPFQVLAALLEKPNEIVTKEELRERIWKDDTFVDFDRSLATAVTKVRHALGDSATHPRFIETVPKHGYRFIGGQAAGSGNASSTTAILSRRRLAWLAAAVIPSTIAVWRLGSSDGRSRSEMYPSAPIPLTSLTGQERHSQLSPDGTHIAFSWNGEDGGDFNIYIRLIGAGSVIQLTKAPGDDLSPVWSVDGRYIYFARELEHDRLSILRVPAAPGGQEISITETSAPGRETASYSNHVGLDSRRDRLVLADRDSSAGPFSLYSHSLTSGTRIRLTDPPEGILGDLSPAVSSDNSAIVFVRFEGLWQGDVHVLDLDDEGGPKGQPRRVTSTTHYFAQSPVFTPDGTEIVYSQWSPFPSLWRVSIDGRGIPRRLVGQGDGGILPSLSAHGRSLTYATRKRDFDIWRLELAKPGVAKGAAARWIYSTFEDIHPDYSHDGLKIAFQSSRSGEHQIFVSDADGQGLEQLTSRKASFCGTPRWSPDGTKIAFDSNAPGGYGIYVMEANGAGQRRVTQDPIGGHSPRWSVEGDWIYFVGSDGGGKFGLWRIRPDGSNPTRLVEESAGRPFVSPDGLYVYHTLGDNSLWRYALDDGAHEPVLQGVYSGASFAVVPEGIYYTPKGPAFTGAEIRFHRFLDESSSLVWRSENSPPDRYGISTDGRFLLFTLAQNVNSDIMLIEDFS